jgi:glutaredoxin
MKKVRFLCLAMLASLTVFSTAQAQQIYRIIGANGRVTFTDVPPVNTPPQSVTLVAAILIPGTANTTGLPFDLQQIALKYPVTLYTTNNCPTCEQGRRYLMSRGVPFAEKTVNSPEEVTAFLKLSGDSPMPYLTIGSESIKGYIEGDWSVYLTAAAYPISSQLPPGYRYANSAPLIDRSQPLTPAPEVTTQAPAETAPPPSASADNPTGIKF